jgi:hypothetical protein
MRPKGRRKTRIMHGMEINPEGSFRDTMPQSNIFHFPTKTLSKNVVNKHVCTQIPIVAVVVICRKLFFKQLICVLPYNESDTQNS